MEEWKVVLLTLGVLVAGMLLPVLWQVRVTLVELRKVLRSTTEGVQPAIEDLVVSSRRVRRITDGLEGKEEELGKLFESAGDMARSIDRLRATTHVATAVASAVAAGIQAFREFQGLEHDAREEGNQASEASGKPVVEEVSDTPEVSQSNVEHITNGTHNATHAA